MKKILVIRFSSIGDIVLTTPVVRCIKKQVTDAEVHFLTKAAFAGILRSNHNIAKVHVLDDELSRTIFQLKQENFDFVVDLHHNLRSARVKSALGKKSGSFNKLNIEKWLMVNFKYNRLPKTHIVDRYMRAASELGVKYDGLGLDYFIPDADKINIAYLPVEMHNGYVAFVIGAKHATKRLPTAKIAQIITAMSLPVVLLGGKEDADAAHEIIRLCNTPVYNACGIYNLNNSASLVQQSKFVITHDTGLMHIAAALGKKIISVWGNTIPEFGMYPFLPDGEGKSVIIENKSLPCRPCSKIGYNKCPKGHFKCMNDLDIDKIVRSAAGWWDIN